MTDAGKPDRCLKVDRLMHAWVPTTTRDETVDAVHKKMLRGKVEYMPVLDGPKIVGVVTIRVIEAILHDKGVIAELMDLLSVGEIMIGTGQTIAPETPVAEAIRVMLRERLNCLPVVDANGEFKGTITAPLLMSHLRDLLQGEAELISPNQSRLRTEPPSDYYCG